MAEHAFFYLWRAAQSPSHVAKKHNSDRLRKVQGGGGFRDEKKANERCKNRSAAAALCILKRVNVRINLWVSQCKICESVGLERKR